MAKVGGKGGRKESRRCKTALLGYKSLFWLLMSCPRLEHLFFVTSLSFSRTVQPNRPLGLPSRWLRSAPVAWEVCPFPVPGPAVPARLSRGPPARVLFPLILYNKVYSLPLPRPFRCSCRFFNPLYCSSLRLASGNFFKKSPPFVLPVSRKRVLLHPLSGTEAAMFERFSPFFGLGPEKKLPWKFGSVAVNPLSLQPVFPVPGSALKKRSLIGLHITIQVVQERVPLHGASG